jgi:hypothetical protein
MRRFARRSVLGGMGAIAATTLTAPLAAAAAAKTSVPNPALDDSHATPRVTRLVTSLFRDKTSRSVDGTMAHFSRNPMFYTDATLGWYMPTWEALRAVFAQYMPTWPVTARSYPTKIIGDERSAIVVFTDSPELFGHEIRLIAAVDFRDGRVARQVDYWDGRHFGIEATNQLRVTQTQFPLTYGEEVVGEQSSPVLRQVAASLHAALGAGDTAGLFTPDATFEDLALRTRLAGAQAIGAYVTRAFRTLPYGAGSAIRHTVGSHQGGGYEWINEGNGVNHGIVAFELDEHQKISRLITTWDGSRLDDTAMTAHLAGTLER